MIVLIVVVSELRHMINPFFSSSYEILVPFEPDLSRRGRKQEAVNIKQTSRKGYKAAGSHESIQNFDNSN